MSPVEVLERCRQIGVRLTPKPNGILGVRGPNAVLTPELIDAVRSAKPELLRLLDQELAETYSQSTPRKVLTVRIESVPGAGVSAGPAYRLVSSIDGKPLGVGLFASERWALAWCAEHGLTLVEAH